MDQMIEDKSKRCSISIAVSSGDIEQYNAKDIGHEFGPVALLQLLSADVVTYTHANWHHEPYELSHTSK